MPTHGDIVLVDTVRSPARPGFTPSWFAAS